jgi:hypothetical protein
MDYSVDKMYMLERYDLYKEDCINNNQTPVELEIYKQNKEYPINYDYDFESLEFEPKKINESTIDIEEDRDFYTLEEAVILTGYELSTIHTYAGKKAGFIKKSRGKLRKLDLDEYLKLRDNPKYKNEKSFYTFSEAANLINRKESTIRRYVREQKKGIVLISSDKIDKLTFDKYVERRKFLSKKSNFKNQYHSYCENIITHHKKYPLKYKDWRKGKLPGTEELIDLNIYMPFDEVVSYLGLSPITIRTYAYDGKFGSIAYRNFSFLLKSDVIQYKNRYYTEDTPDDNSFYTYDEAAEILGLAVGTVKSYINYDEYGLVRISTNKLDKESVDKLAAKRLEETKNYDIQQNYENYVKTLFKEQKVPLSKDEWLNNSTQLGRENKINLKEYITFEEAIEELKFTETTLKAYIRNGTIESLIPGFYDYLLKDSVINYHKNMQIERAKKQAEKEKKRLEEERLENLKNIVSNCFIGGYIQCNNAFVKETLVTHITPVHGQVRIFSKDELNDISFLSDADGNILNFKTSSEARQVIIYLLKQISIRKQSYKG